MKPVKMVQIIYTGALVIFAVSSTLMTWANDEIIVLGLEIGADLVIIAGVILAAAGVKQKKWIIFMILAMIAEIYLLATETRATALDKTIWITLLAPALYFHATVVGFAGGSIKKGRTTA
jgi:hypothetical protein